MIIFHFICIFMLICCTSLAHETRINTNATNLSFYFLPTDYTDFTDLILSF